MTRAVLYAIPSPLGGRAEEALPAAALSIVRALRDFAVENPKSARAFLAAVGMPCPLRDLNIVPVESDPSPLMRPLVEGRPLGLLSEAGCPAVADPGAALVEAAHRAGFRVVPLIGPSSIMLALMASGLEGQRFAFCGYLPRQAGVRERRIRELEERSRRERETEIFIETPYRNEALLAALAAACRPSTRLCVAADLTLASESIVTLDIAAWRGRGEAVGRRPAVFLLLA